MNSQQFNIVFNFQMKSIQSVRLIRWYYECKSDVIDRSIEKKSKSLQSKLRIWGKKDE